MVLKKFMRIEQVNAREQVALINVNVNVNVNCKLNKGFREAEEWNEGGIWVFGTYGDKAFIAFPPLVQAAQEGRIGSKGVGRGSIQR